MIQPLKKTQLSKRPHKNFIYKKARCLQRAFLSLLSKVSTLKAGPDIIHKNFNGVKNDREDKGGSPMPYRGLG